MTFRIEENLDLHYWMACPMLVSCKLCEQVVEIPTLNDHLTNECEASNQVVTCATCLRPLCDADEVRRHQDLCPGKANEGNKNVVHSLVNAFADLAREVVMSALCASW